MSYLGDYYDASGPCDVKGPMRANANRMIQELECWYVVSAMARIIMFVTKTRVMRTFLTYERLVTGMREEMRNRIGLSPNLLSTVRPETAIRFASLPATSTSRRSSLRESLKQTVCKRRFRFGCFTTSLSVSAKLSQLVGGLAYARCRVQH